MPNEPRVEGRDVSGGPGARSGDGRSVRRAAEAPSIPVVGEPTVGSSASSREDSAERIRAASREASKAARRRIGQGGG